MANQLKENKEGCDLSFLTTFRHLLVSTVVLGDRAGNETGLVEPIVVL